MSFFKRAHKREGWFACSLHQRHLLAACVAGSAGSPVVQAIQSASIETSSVAALEKLARELNAHPYQCSHLLGLNEYQLVSLEAPNVPADELRSAVRWKLKDLLDFHVDDATIDVFDIPKDKHAVGRAASMYAVAARNSIIKDRQSLFEKAELGLSVIDVPEMAQRNISALLETEGRGVALLSFEEVGGLLTFTSGGELYLSRRIEITREQLTQAVLSDDKALLDRITLELQRSLDHFERQFHYVNLSRLVLAPMGRNANALQVHLAQNLYLPVEILDLSSVIDVSAVKGLLDPEIQQDYFLIIGAALRREEKAL